MRETLNKGFKTTLIKTLICIGIIVVFLSMSIGLAVVILYKSGEVSLKSNLNTDVPVISLSDDEIATTVVTGYADATIPWQDDWIAYDSKVYEYNSDTLNFILLGIDHAGELSKNTELKDWSAGQADTIFLISLDQKNKNINVIAIPRNSMIELDIFNEQEKRIDTIYNQICLQYGYAGGGELGLSEMKSAVSKLFYNLPIHGAIALSFDAIGVLADAIGGVDIIIEDDLTEANPMWTQGTEITLTSKNIMNYLRYRGTVFKSTTVRLNRQKEFMKIALAKAISEIKKNPGMVADLYQKINPYMNTDISLNQAVYIATNSMGYKLNVEGFKQLTGEEVEVPMEIVVDEKYTTYDDLYLDEDALLETMILTFYSQVVMK